jgi:hypothetical protein
MVFNAFYGLCRPVKIIISGQNIDICAVWSIQQLEQKYSARWSCYVASELEDGLQPRLPDREIASGSSGFAYPAAI